MKLDYLKTFKNCLDEHAELRLQQNSTVSLALVNGSLVRNEKNTSSGISSRVYKNGFFGFASSPKTDEKTVKDIINKSKENAIMLANLEKRNKSQLSGENFEVIKDFSTKKPRVSRKAKLDFLKKLHEYTAKTYKDLKSDTFVINNLDMEKNLLTSFGASGFTMIPRTLLVISLSIEKDGNTYNSYDVFGGLGQYEDYFDNPEEFYEKIDKVYTKVKEKSEGVYPEAGYKDVIMDSKLAGILAHEAIGHTTEADMVKSGSVAKDYFGEKVASDLINLVDFAYEYNNQVCPMPVYIDDEGTRPEDAVIIENGILKRYMNNKDLSRDLNDKPTGNARAYDFSDEPLVRMRNTAILPGDDKLEDMIASIEDGYYLTKPSNGQADSTSEFMFGVPNGYEIKNGKLGRAIKDTTISGVAFDVLKTVSMVSDEMTWSNAGMCGKKQVIPVGMGGPAIKCKINIGGR
ncbi:TldD/PmbA family protein [Natranaerobius trueperi]|uniref:Peptidase n=1 Tax=Natranaerobius trueperi TaxID=759412 RepID=A0A226C001_9FIRM|nr:TldD/PmbA family protein [Natranaerobius trueperi]OWZ83769.1 peptidase [Natranaerobius trueperi]